MLNTIKKSLVALGVVSLSFSGMIAVGGIAAAVDPIDDVRAGYEGAGGNDTNGDLQGSIKDVVNVLLFILGVIAVIVIIIGGIRYATSGGDSSQTSGAKNTILYAVIGLIVAILAYAIVNFVIGAFAG